MNDFIFLMVNLAVSCAFSQTDNTQRFETLQKDNDISEINDGQYDIMVPKFQRSSLNNNLWTSPIPYVLDQSLDVNAKAVILKAFEQYRVKSCIDFKLRDDETDYIIVKKLKGCFSFIGKIGGEQELSIGQNCDRIPIVEHEFLHALGFSHEHSRYDRDNFVKINFDNVKPGMEHNFKKVSKDFTNMGVPYDYWSVMHYSKFAQSNGNGNTIITKDQRFQNVIGQKQGMSPGDILELNRRYSCNSTIVFKMYCGFSNRTTCNMKHCSKNKLKWKLVTRAEGGPNSDHTSLPSGIDRYADPDEGYFMHASTVSGRMGDSAMLETQRMSTRRVCAVKCLQFYYYHSGHESDHLNIWIRIFKSEWDSKGSRRLMGKITGPQTSHWRLHYVSLVAAKHFQVEFEIVKGTERSSGGFSIDDINLSETECLHGIIQVNDVVETFSTTKSKLIYSPRQYTKAGYAYRISVIGNKDRVGMGIQLLSGKYDDQLEWPCPYRQAVLQIVDQTPNLQLHMSKQKTFTTDPKVNTRGIWYDDPRKSGITVTTENGEILSAGPLYSFDLLSYEVLISRDFIKGKSAMFAYSFQDITPLVNGSELPCTTGGPVKTVYPPRGVDDGPCSSWIVPTTQPPPPPTDDRIFGFSPGMAASPVLALLLALMLMM